MFSVDGREGFSVGSSLTAGFGGPLHKPALRGGLLCPVLASVEWPVPASKPPVDSTQAPKRPGLLCDPRLCSGLLLWWAVRARGQGEALSPLLTAGPHCLVTVYASSKPTPTLDGVPKL